MYRDIDEDKRRNAHFEKVMFSAWLKESGEANDNQIEHLKNCVRVAISEALTDRQRECLGLYLSGYCQSEIAEMLGISRSTVSRNISRGLKRLLDRVKYATPSTLRVVERVRKNLTRLYK